MTELSENQLKILYRAYDFLCALGEENETPGDSLPADAPGDEETRASVYAPTPNYTPDSVLVKLFQFKQDCDLLDGWQQVSLFDIGASEL
jgi:hypothetical protein